MKNLPFIHYQSSILEEDFTLMVPLVPYEIINTDNTCSEVSALKDWANIANKSLNAIIEDQGLDNSIKHKALKYKNHIKNHFKAPSKLADVCKKIEKGNLRAFILKKHNANNLDISPQYSFTNMRVFIGRDYHETEKNKIEHEKLFKKDIIDLDSFIELCKGNLKEQNIAIITEDNIKIVILTILDTFKQNSQKKEYPQSKKWKITTEVGSGLKSNLLGYTHKVDINIEKVELDEKITSESYQQIGQGKLNDRLLNLIYFLEINPNDLSHKEEEDPYLEIRQNYLYQNKKAEMIIFLIQFIVALIQIELNDNKLNDNNNKKIKESPIIPWAEIFNIIKKHKDYNKFSIFDIVFSALCNCWKDLNQNTFNKTELENIKSMTIKRWKRIYSDDQNHYEEFLILSPAKHIEPIYQEYNLHLCMPYEEYSKKVLGKIVNLPHNELLLEKMISLVFFTIILSACALYPEQLINIMSGSPLINITLINNAPLIQSIIIGYSYSFCTNKIVNIFNDSNDNLIDQTLKMLLLSFCIIFITGLFFPPSIYTITFGQAVKDIFSLNTLIYVFNSSILLTSVYQLYILLIEDIINESNYITNTGSQQHEVFNAPQDNIAHHQQQTETPATERNLTIT
jgi:hypothetical protein